MVNNDMASYYSFDCPFVFVHRTFILKSFFFLSKTSSSVLLGCHFFSMENATMSVYMLYFPFIRASGQSLCSPVYEGKNNYGVFIMQVCLFILHYVLHFWQSVDIMVISRPWFLIKMDLSLFLTLDLWYWVQSLPLQLAYSPPSFSLYISKFFHRCMLPYIL